MKYTKYLIDGTFVDLDSVIPQKGFFKYPMVMITIPVAIIGLVTIGSALPIAFVADNVRNFKCTTIRYRRKNLKSVTIPDIFRIMDKPIHTIKVYGNIITKRH